MDNTMMLPIPPLRVVKDEPKMLTKVFVVSGSSGEYEDRHSWTVSAFFVEALAEELATKLNDWCMAERVHSDIPREEQACSLDLTCPLDPHFHASYTGARYRVWSLNVEGSPGERP